MLKPTRTYCLVSAMAGLVVATAFSFPFAAHAAQDDDPGAIVDRFIAAFNDKDLATVESLFTEDAVYHNLPGEPVTGKEAVMQVIRGYVTPSETIDWKVTHQAVSGNVVLNERVDRFVLGGKEIVLPVMGTFEIRDGRIAAWRDYFDMATWQRQAGN